MGEKRLCYGCMEFKPEDAAVCPICGYEDGTPYDPEYIAPGTLLNDRYVIGRRLGANSEGANYIGYNQSIDCRVLIREYMPQGLCTRVRGKATISVKPQQVVQYKTLMAEFTELNKRLAQMRNVTHINPTLDLFACNNTTYAVYEYLEGIKLIDYLKENAGELTWKQVSEMFPTFFTTLSLIHNNGIIHRAISPDTIYVTEKNELRLCAFCIPTVRTVHTELPCEIFHGYAAPEQYSPNARQGTWTDVYGLCAVLYRILTGCKPTDAPSRMQNDNLCAPHEMNPSIPRHVSRVIMRGMSLISDDRIQTITELVTELFEEPTEPEPKPIPVESSRRQQRRQEEYDDYRRVPPQTYDEDDYEVQGRENVIDRIKIPIIIGVLLTCVLLVIAIIVLHLMDMWPASDPNSTQPTETIATAATEDTNNVVPEPSDASDVSESTGDSQMPDLVGKNFEKKKEQLGSDGWLNLDATYEYSDEHPAGEIIWQELEPGTPFTSGATVRVTVSKGPSSITLPPFEGKTLMQYEDELDKLGMTNYNTEAVINYNYSNNMVISLSKDAGEKFDLTGTETLKIYYASNPETTAPPETQPTTELAPPDTTPQPTDAPVTEPPEPATEAPTEIPPPPAPEDQGGDVQEQ